MNECKVDSNTTVHIKQNLVLTPVHYFCTVGYCSRRSSSSNLEVDLKIYCFLPKIIRVYIYIFIIYLIEVRLVGQLRL